jgi:hypothetical protein
MTMPRTLLAVAAIAIVSCSDPLGPLIDGKPYALVRINGQPVPWTSPLGGSITDGSIKLDNDSLAERQEGFTNGGWTFSGKYTLRFDRLIVDYRPGWQPGWGPLHPVDTFLVSGNGLVLRETGFLAPVDSMVRYYARP